MKKIIIFIVLICSFISHSQDIAVKNDQVLFDKVPVANFEKLGADFKFKSLNNSNSITAIWTYIKISEYESKNYLTIIDSEGKRKSEVQMEFLPSTSNLNMKKAIAVLLSKKYNLITVNGVENIDSFFAVERNSISGAIEKQKNGYQNAQKELASLNYQILAVDKLIVSGDVPKDAFTSKYSQEENNEFANSAIGNYKVYSTKDSSPYAISNIDIISFSGRTIVHAVESGDKIIVVLTESKKTFNYQPKSRIDVNNYNSYSDAILEVINNAYTNGQKFLTLAEAKAVLKTINIEKKEKFAEAKLNSDNIYEKKGYVIDDKGEKTEGKISLDFEKIVPQGSSNGMVDLDGVGKLLTVVVTNEKGKYKYYNFKAKKGVSFAINNNDNTESKYTSLQVKMGKPTVKDSSVLDLDSALGFNLGSSSWKYFKEIYITEKMSIYQDLPSNFYVIKIPNQEKGFQILINSGKEDKFLSKLKEYLGDSIESSQLEKIDYSSLEGLKNLVELYSNFK